MRIPTRRRDDPMQDSVGMTPMIDVVFLLLIFFICAAVGQVHELLLPAGLEAGATEANVTTPPQERLFEDVWLMLKVDAEGKTVITLQERVYDDESQLAVTLQNLVEVAPEIPVILDPQPNVPVGDVIRVYDLAKAVGFQSLHFATDPPKVTQ